jgi:hypothetical protein
MELRLADRVFGPGEFAVMADGVVAGADIAVVAPDPAEIARVRTGATPPAVIAVAPRSASEGEACVRAGAGLLLGDAYAEVAAATGAALACSSPAGAVGVRADGLLVVAREPAGTGRLAEAGLAVLAEDPEPAVVAVHAWLGARVFRTGDVRRTRQVLDMVASIQGARSPAVTRRGLA